MFQTFRALVLQMRRPFAVSAVLRGKRGSILLLVLWTVAVLAIITLNFAFQTRTHVSLASHYAQSAQLRHIAFAGVEYAIMALQQDSEFADPDHLGDIWAEGGEFERVEVGNGYFSLVRDAQGEESASLYGLEDEASKLNLRTATEEMLLRFEGLDAALVDALLDWQDADSQARPQGAETEYYQLLAVPYACKNAALTTLHELLLVKGFDEIVLYGEKRSGIRVSGSGETRASVRRASLTEGAARVLETGILPYITLYSEDRNVTLENEARVNIAQASAAELRQAIPDLTQQEADAIVQYRGRTPFQQIGDLLKVTASASQSGGQESGGSRTGRRGSESRGDRGGGSSRDRGSSGGSGQASGADAGQKVFTPERLQEIIDYCSLGGDATTPGRININTAPVLVLRTLPGMTEELAEMIVARRSRGSGVFRNIAELLDVPGMTEEIFIPLSNLVTVRSFQFRVNSRARIEGIYSQATVEAVLDRSGDRIGVLYWNEG